MQPIIIRHTVEKAREGSYYAIPFSMPAGAESVTIRYQYKKEGNIVDLGLADGAGRFLGWSGSARDTVTLGPYSATPGYRMTPLTPGTWQILVGAYRIPEAGLPVEYTITFTAPQRRWLKGDLHVHSTASDGQLDAYALARKARDMGLDFLAIADHNNYCENFHLPVLPGLTLIPAVEWTHYKGHINFFGARAPFDNSFIANTQEEMRSLLEHVRENGALISVNHPKDPTCPYLWQEETGFHMIEVWNGPMRRANREAVRWWHSLLLQGRRIPIVGGSDFHREKAPVRFAQPTTFLYADSPAAEDLCVAMKAGRCFISGRADGVRLGILGGTCFGQAVPAQPGKAWHFTGENGRPGMVLLLITDKGITAKTRFGNNSAVTLAAREAPWRFAYLVAGYPIPGGLNIRAISNPVYFDPA